MGIDFTLLDPEFGKNVERLLQNCEERGFKLVPFFGIRNVWDQAKLWRQSRPWPQIEAAITMLERSEAPWLAKVLGQVGPQYGRWATNCLPGISWHQYGLAIDCYVSDVPNGRAIWNPNHDGYRIYAREAVSLGMFPTYYWKKRDAVHVQAIQERVLEKYSWAEINVLMEDKFGDLSQPQEEVTPEEKTLAVDDSGEPAVDKTEPKETKNKKKSKKDKENN